MRHAVIIMIVIVYVIIFLVIVFVIFVIVMIAIFASVIRINELVNETDIAMMHGGTQLSCFLVNIKWKK